MFTNVNNIWLQSTSKSHVSTYKLLFLVSRALCLCLFSGCKKVACAPLNWYADDTQLYISTKSNKTLWELKQRHWSGMRHSVGSCAYLRHPVVLKKTSGSWLLLLVRSGPVVYGRITRSIKTGRALFSRSGFRLSAEDKFHRRPAKKMKSSAV